jgi:phosphoribosylformimino-5-aminoimidazole carboxamide ribotide isomerase
MGKNFRIIPALDIQNGQAVGTRLGSNREYNILKSKIVKNSIPINIINRFIDEFNFREIYIADLDQIIEIDSENTNVLQKICDIPNISVILDIGLRSRKQFRLLKEIGADQVVITTETLKTTDTINKAIDFFGVDKVIVSMDAVRNKLISRSVDISTTSLIDFAKKMEDIGIEKLLLLDLSQIGAKNGALNKEFLKIRENFPHEIIIGGGIGNISHVSNLKNLGFDGALVATSLHQELITSKDIKEI